MKDTIIGEWEVRMAVVGRSIDACRVMVVQRELFRKAILFAQSW